MFSKGVVWLRNSQASCRPRQFPFHDCGKPTEKSQPQLLNFPKTTADHSLVDISYSPGGRAGGRLRLAREHGYLDAACDRSLPQWHSRWCWRLRIPVIWMERCSPHSKYGRLHLDLFTTSQALTPLGREALQGLSARFGIAGAVRITAHDGWWDRVSVDRLEPLAEAVLRTVTRPGNWELDLPLPSTAGPAELLAFPERATA